MCTSITLTLDNPAFPSAVYDIVEGAPAFPEGVLSTTLPHAYSSSPSVSHTLALILKTAPLPPVTRFGEGITLIPTALEPSAEILHEETTLLAHELLPKGVKSRKSESREKKSLETRSVKHRDSESRKIGSLP